MPENVVHQGVPSRFHVQVEGSPANAIEVAAPAFGVGRDADNDVVLDDPNVSRHHCRFFRQDGCWYIEDLGSRNGVRVDGQRIHSPTLVAVGTVVGVGAACISLAPGPAAIGQKRSPLQCAETGVVDGRGYPAEPEATGSPVASRPPTATSGRSTVTADPGSSSNLPTGATPVDDVGVGVLAGILTCVAYLFIFFLCCLNRDAEEGTGSGIVPPLVGLVAGAGAVVITKTLSGLLRAGLLTAVGALVLVLAALFGSLGGDLFMSISFLCGGGVRFMALGVVLLVLMQGAVQARRSAPESETIRWTVCGLATSAMMLQAAYGLLLFAGTTGWARNLSQTLTETGAAGKVAFIWVTVAVWVLLIIGLVNALHEKSRLRTAALEAVAFRVFLWSIAGLVILAALVALTTPEGRSRHNSSLETLMKLLVGAVAILLPLFAGTLLAVRSSAAAMLWLDRRTRHTSGTGGRPAAGASAISPHLAAVSNPAANGRQVQVGSDEPDLAERLRKLKDLHDAELITTAEYEAKKRELLDQI